MATRIAGEKFGVYVKDGASWLLAVCTTSITVDQSRNSIEFQDNCTGGSVGKLPTTINNAISFEGNVTTDPGVNEIGYNDLRAKMDAGTIDEWKIENEDSSIIYYAESAFLESMNSTFPVGDLSTYSISLAIDGALLDAVPS